MSNGKTICTVCNYIYDESKGKSDTKQRLKFEDLSDEWKCPECGSTKDMFQPCSCVSFPSHGQNCAVKTEKKNVIDGSMTVGQIVAEHPSVACLLEQYGIDYCCGGKGKLDEACRKKGVKVEYLLEKFRAVIAKEGQSHEPDWTQSSLQKLIEHIVESYHEPLRQELVRVIELADKVARVHGENHPEMIKVKEVLADLRTQLELHMQKEEMILFPAIVRIEAGGDPQFVGCGGGIEQPIDVMTQEHEVAGDALGTMRQLTHEYTPPSDACNTFKVLLHSLAKFEAQMHEHVHKENNILFPRALLLRGINKTQATATKP